jgi:hypothetical protein
LSSEIFRFPPLRNANYRFGGVFDQMLQIKNTHRKRLGIEDFSLKIFVYAGELNLTLILRCLTPKHNILSIFCKPASDAKAIRMTIPYYKYEKLANAPRRSDLSRHVEN